MHVISISVIFLMLKIYNIVKLKWFIFSETKWKDVHKSQNSSKNIAHYYCTFFKALETFFLMAATSTSSVVPLPEQLELVLATAAPLPLALVEGDLVTSAGGT